MDIGSSSLASCSRCGGRVRRQQRVFELPDEDVGLLSLSSLHAALADISVSEDICDSAVLLSGHGPDPEVMARFPEFATQMADLEIPPVVQRALVQRGFFTLEQVLDTAAGCSDAGSFSARFGLSPAAEVILRRFWQVAADGKVSKLYGQKRPPRESQVGLLMAPKSQRAASSSSPLLCDMAGDEDDIHEGQIKRCRQPLEGQMLAENDRGVMDEDDVSD